MNTLEQALPKLFKNGVVTPEKLNRYLAPGMTVALVIACSYTLSQLTWLLIPEDELPTAPAGLHKPARPTSMQSTPTYRHISEAHLFGVYQQTSAKSVTTDAPETRLNLVLKGVLAATPVEQASAIISMGKNGQEDTYGIGDRVSSATVREIHPDRVILERAGRLETLRMPTEFDNDLIQTAPSTPSSQSGGNSTGAILSDIRQEILKNPTSFGQYAIPIPYNENGRLRGYRLQPQGDSKLFDTVGLQASDVIIEVNGVELNNPSMGIKALRSLQQAKEINLTVLRNGAEIPLHFEIP